MATETPARESREASRSTVKRALIRALGTTEVSGAALANACGVPQQKVAKWCDLDGRESIPLHDLLQAPAAVALDLLRLVAQHHGLDVVPAADASVDPADVRTLHGVLATTSALALTHAESLADGHLDVSEARQILSDAQDVIESATRLANGARARIREHEESARRGAVALVREK